MKKLLHLLNSCFGRSSAKQARSTKNAIQGNDTLQKKSFSNEEADRDLFSNTCYMDSPEIREEYKETPKKT